MLLRVTVAYACVGMRLLAVLDRVMLSSQRWKATTCVLSCFLKPTRVDFHGMKIPHRCSKKKESR